MPDASLIVLLEEVRGKTLALLSGVRDDEARWAPPGLQNTILWHAGHAYVVVEHLVAAVLDREPVYPPGWFDLFSWESRPGETPPEAWPPLAEVVRGLTEQRDQLRQVFESTSPEALDRRLPMAGGQTARRRIIHALHDEACHSGEIWLLRKMQA